MKLGYTIIYVADPKRSAEFWERAFGVKQRSMDDSPMYREMETGEHTLSFVAGSYVRDNIPGGFRAPQNDEAPPPFEVALTTDDVAAALERAVKAGAHKVLPPTKKPWGQTVAYVRDCDGTLVELCTPMG
ncbi:MAG TPA: VOC family protein [Polyangia bacterium]|jgi:predicted enzyme related to lactoylglutathione lyase